jgi:hypothetical protein
VLPQIRRDGAERTVCRGRAGRALRARITLWALGAIPARRSWRARFSGRTGFSHRALGAIRAGRAYRAPKPLGALWTFKTLWTLRTYRTLGSNRPRFSLGPGGQFDVDYLVLQGIDLILQMNKGFSLDFGRCVRLSDNKCQGDKQRFREEDFHFIFPRIMPWTPRNMCRRHFHPREINY